jgi:hypothetical protein
LIALKSIYVKKISLLSLYFILSGIFALSLSAQESATVRGLILDTNGYAIPNVHIMVDRLSDGTISDSKGQFSMSLPAEEEINMVFTHKTYKQSVYTVTLKQGENHEIRVVMNPGVTVITPFKVTATGDKGKGMDRVDHKIAPFISSPSMNPLNEMIKRTGLGVTNTNELSAQYSVRGGNFDENLIYVNGIEIYRPFLVRSGQQEGLSFVNSDLTESVWFSSGGFDAEYGDKMSSVLDVTYKKPTEFDASAFVSLQGASFYFQNASNNKKLRYLAGFRQKSNQYVLNSLETTGEYQPSFTDLQTFINYQPFKKFEISFLGNYARNSYKFFPEDRETRFGTLNDALRFKVYFDGQEVDRFETMFGAIDFTFKPSDRFKLSFITSAFHSEESETFDIIGQYWLDALNLNFGNDDFGDVAFNKGVGTFFNHARNYLTSDIVNFQFVGSYRDSSNFRWKWGLKYQLEMVDDYLNEWEMIDSAGYSLPHRNDSIGYTRPDLQTNNSLELSQYYNIHTRLNTSRFTGYIQNTWKNRLDTTTFSITSGVRFHYWDYNKKLLISPRATAIYEPRWERNVLFRLSGGYYYQPAFFKELKNIDGEVLRNVDAQKSLQFVAGAEWFVKFWNRSFKVVSEIYYKDFQNLIPYELDNVRIRYFADLTSKGYAMGLDMKINGEFVRGVESWIGLSLMQTHENIDGDFYYDCYNKYDSLIVYGETQDTEIAYSIKREAGYKPRPTDQLVNFNLFFQDYLPNMKDLKMHMNLVWGTRLPFGPPRTKNYKEPGRMKAYKRVDIGFSKQFLSYEGQTERRGILRYIENLWLSVEVFNLLQFSNNMAYTWITDVNNNLYAIPSRLTPRQLNVKLLVDF